MKKVIFLLFLVSSLFAVQLMTIREVIENDKPIFDACALQKNCDLPLKSFKKYGVVVTVDELGMFDTKTFNWLAECYDNPSSPSCNNLAMDEDSLRIIKESLVESIKKREAVNVEETQDYLFTKNLNFKGVEMGGLLFIIFILAVLAWLSTIFVVVSQKRAVVIEVFGKFWGIKEAGLRLKFPAPIAKVAGTLNLQIRELASDITVQSKDKAFLTIPVKVQYKVIPENAKEAFYELSEPEEQIKSYIFNTIRSKAFDQTMDSLFSDKTTLEDDAKNALTNTFKDYGYEIVNVLIDNPQPSEEIVFAFNRVIASAREKDAAENEAEALKIKLVGEAKAEKASLILKGEAFKEYRALIAEGNVEALGLMKGTHIIKDNVTQGEKTLEDGSIISSDVVTREIVENTNFKESGLTDKDILDFFAGVDQREAIRDAARGDGNTVVVSMAPTGGNSNEADMSKLIALIESLKK